MHEDQATRALPPALAQPASGRLAPFAPVRKPERQVLDVIERILRAGHRLPPWSVLVLHLSQMPGPGPHPHHRRVAAALLEDAAARTAGQLFTLSDGDLALLFRPADQGDSTVATITHLFQAGLSGSGVAHTLWHLPEGAPAILAYLTQRLPPPRAAAAPYPPASEAEPSPGLMAAVDAVVSTGALADLTHRQTAVLLRPGHAQSMQPLFREVAISTAVLEARIAVAGIIATDAFLFNHLAAQLDRRMLHELAVDIPNAGPLSLGLGGAALHLNLTTAGILSPAFANFADAWRDAKDAPPVGVELALAEAINDPQSFVTARERLRLAGMSMLLDGVTHHTLPMIDVAALRAPLLKLSWCPSMPEAGPALSAAIARAGPQHVMLHRTETEAAIAWGIAHGITRFQGRYIDAMLAAARIRACPAGQARPSGAPACQLRQCIERASATGPAGRAGCRATTLLDLAAPPPPAPATAVIAA